MAASTSYNSFTRRVTSSIICGMTEASLAGSGRFQSSVMPLRRHRTPFDARSSSTRQYASARRDYAPLCHSRPHIPLLTEGSWSPYNP
eukprot:scaffold3017_cov229-Prasinococcus_capsulatus_cf.AAC.3